MKNFMSKRLTARRASWAKGVPRQGSLHVRSQPNNGRFLLHLRAALRESPVLLPLLRSAFTLHARAPRAAESRQYRVAPTDDETGRPIVRGGGTMKCLRALIGAHAFLAFKIKERSNGSKFSGTTTSASPVLASSISVGLPRLPTLSVAAWFAKGYFA